MVSQVYKYLKYRALGRRPKAQSVVLDNTPVAMLLAIRFASVKAQKHLAERQYIIQQFRPGRGLVSTCTLGTSLGLLLKGLRQRPREKTENHLATMKFG